jgi:hypothetical protein
LQHRRGSWRGACKDEVRLKRDEFLRKSFHRLDIGRRPSLRPTAQPAS